MSGALPVIQGATGLGQILSSATTKGNYGQNSSSVNPYALNLGQNWANTGNTPYQGQMTAGPSALQNQGFNQAANLGNNQVNASGSNLLQSILNGNNLNVNANPYVQGMASSIITPAQQQLGQARDTLASQAQQAGAGGGGQYMNAANMLNSNSATNLSNSLSNLYGGLYSQAQNQQTQALGMVPSYNNMSLNNLQSLMNAGNTQQQLNQQPLTAAYQEWIRQQSPTGYQSMGANLLNNAYQSNNQQQTTPQTPWWGGSLGGLGLEGLGLGIGSLFGSGSQQSQQFMAPGNNLSISNLGQYYPSIQ